MSTRAMRRAERRKQKRDGRGQGPRSFPWFTVLVVAVVLVFGYLGLRAIGAFEAAPGGAIIDPNQYRGNNMSVGQQVQSMGDQHLNTGQKFTAYNSTPPTSGPHDPSPQPYGVYDSPVADERVVHSLEHGAVFIGHNGIGDQDLANLKQLRQRWPRGKFQSVKIIIAPYPRLEPGTIALTAWGWIDKMTTYDERRILSFIAAHIERGPEDAP